MDGVSSDIVNNCEFVPRTSAVNNLASGEGDGHWAKDRRPLSRGGFGVVSKWVHSKSRETLAIKRFFINPQISSRRSSEWPEEYAGKCLEEVKRLGSLEHRNIVKAKRIPSELSQAIEQEGKSFLEDGREFVYLSRPILCMEYCNRGDVRRLLGKPENLSGLPEEVVRGILHDISHALTYLHTHNVIHRDIKPENILIHSAFQGLVTYKLGDLGLSKDLPKIDKSFSSLVGTDSYMAPEMMYSRKPNYKVDYWSFGMTVVEIMYGSWHFTKLGWEKSSPVPTQHHHSRKFCDMVHMWLQTMLDVNIESRGVVGKQMQRVAPSEFELYDIRPDDPFERNSLRLRGDNALIWMENILNKPVLNLEPNISIILHNESTKMGQLRRELVPPVAPFETDVLVAIREPLAALVVKPQEYALTFALQHWKLFAFSKSLPQKYALKVPGIVMELLRVKENTSFTEDQRQQLWIDALFYCQTEIRLAKGFLASLECLEVLEVPPSRKSRSGRWRSRGRDPPELDSEEDSLETDHEAGNFDGEAKLEELQRTWLSLCQWCTDWTDLNSQRLNRLSDTLVHFLRTQNYLMDYIYKRIGKIFAKKFRGKRQSRTVMVPVYHVLYPVLTASNSPPPSPGSSQSTEIYIGGSDDSVFTRPTESHQRSSGGHSSSRRGHHSRSRVPIETHGSHSGSSNSSQGERRRFRGRGRRGRRPHL